MSRSARHFILQFLLAVGVALSAQSGVNPEGNRDGKRILFVCTGNFYRSRFAEAIFNQKAHDAHSSWVAISRGLQLDPTQHGISAYALEELKKRGVPRALWAGAPKALTRADLEQSDYVVLMDEAEHRPMLEKQFPSHEGPKIHYWKIGEADTMSPSQACQLMTKDAEDLLRTLPR